MIKRIHHLLPLQARLTLYNSLIFPLFVCGDPVWDDKGNKTLMNGLAATTSKQGSQGSASFTT